MEKNGCSNREIVLGVEAKINALPASNAMGARQYDFARASYNYALNRAEPTDKDVAAAETWLELVEGRFK